MESFFKDAVIDDLALFVRGMTLSPESSFASDPAVAGGHDPFPEEILIKGKGIKAEDISLRIAGFKRNKQRLR